MPKCPRMTDTHELKSGVALSKSNTGIIYNVVSIQTPTVHSACLLNNAALSPFVNLLSGCILHKPGSVACFRT